MLQFSPIFSSLSFPGPQNFRKFLAESLKTQPITTIEDRFTTSFLEEILKKRCGKSGLSFCYGLRLQGFPCGKSHRWASAGVQGEGRVWMCQALCLPSIWNDGCSRIQTSAGPPRGASKRGSLKAQESGRKAPLFCNAAFSRLPCSFKFQGRKKYTPPPWRPSFFSFSRSEALWCIPFFPDLWCIPFSLVFPGKWYTP